MNRSDPTTQVPLAARVVHKSALVERDDVAVVTKLMLNLLPQGRIFDPGTDVGIAGIDDAPGALRRYTIESVGRVPFEDSIDITLYIRDAGRSDPRSVSRHLMSCEQGDTVTLFGPFSNPFYPPMGSRSNLIMIGAGTGMVPFRWLARKIQDRRLDWMGKVLMLEGRETGLEHLYLNRRLADADQYFDDATRRAFEALKTRYSAIASDAPTNPAAHCEALWRLMGQGSVYVYLAGYRDVAEAFDAAMESHLRLPGRWLEAKDALERDGHWLEYLYD
jgi:ferredoxin-NADP reductase